MGPTNDSDDAQEFRDHVTRVKNTLWEMYLAPIGEALVRRPTDYGR
jgi:hypothetical protein